MALNGSKLLGLAGMAWLVVASVAACNGGVTNSDGTGGSGAAGSGSTGTGSECTTPPPPSGWCPASWVCIDGAWTDTSGDCPNPCPTDRPATGSFCEAVGAVCSYEEYWEEECGEGGYTETLEVTCTEDGWSSAVYKCSPPIECPDELPLAGTDCSDWLDAYSCTFTVETSCGETFADAWCDGATWQVNVLNQCGSCSALTSAGACEGAAGCAWLEPGCGEPAVQQGCYPEEPCAVDSCANGETCATVVYDPCWNSPCDACGAETNVCLPLNDRPSP